MVKLFQEHPAIKDPNPVYRTYSHTVSLESYHRHARRESWILKNNNRTPNLENVMRYWHPFPLEDMKDFWAKIQRQLTSNNIDFMATIELTTRYGYPNNCVHYHFFFDVPNSTEEMKELLKKICLNSGIGIYRKDFDIVTPNQGITKENLNRKLDYFTKCRRVKRQIDVKNSPYAPKVWLFKAGLKIQKYYYSKNWFLDQDGNVITKKDIYERIKREYKEKKGFSK